LLLCGEAVEINLYDWKKKTIKTLECSFEPYWWLVEICFFENTPTQFLVDFITSIISHPFDQKSTQTDMNNVMKMMEIYLGRKQNRNETSKQRLQLRNVPPKDLKDGLVNFEMFQSKKKREDILNKLEDIKEVVVKAKKIDSILFEDLFVMEESIQNDQFNISTMKRILKVLVQKYEQDDHWLKSVTASMEIVGWMQLKDNRIMEILKALIKDTRHSLHLKIYATEALLKLDSEKSKNRKGMVLLLDEDKDLIHEIVGNAFNSTEKEIKEVAVRVLSIPGAIEI